MTKPTVALRCQLSNSHALCSGEQMLYLLVEIGAPDVALSQRSPINLCITLDQSGSMDGEKLTAAKFAVAEVVNQLESGDICTLVAFHGIPTVVFEPAQMDARAKQAADRRRQ